MRPLKFVKYLPDFDIQPIVFCPQKAAWKAYDYKNLKLPFLKEIPIYRYGIRRLQRYYHLRYNRGIRRHPYFYLLAFKYILFLDFFSAWYFECREKALEIAQKESVDCIFTTSPPHSIHLFGSYLKKRLNLPWVMDIRDALANDPNRRSNLYVGFQSKIETHYEKRFYSAADAVVTVSDPIRDSILRRHPSMRLGSKIRVISNGFDEEDFSAIRKEAAGNHPFTVTYAGSFMGKRTPKFFLQAIHALVSSGRIDPAELSIRFIGHYNQSTLALFQQFAGEIPLEVLEFQPYYTSLRYQVESDLLLLIVNIDESEGGSQIMTGKFFEYVGAQRPIFALVPEGPLKQIINQGQFGYTVSQKNVPAIAEAFKKIYKQWKKHGYINYKPDLDLRNSFTRKQLTGRLAEIIESIT